MEKSESACKCVSEAVKYRSIDFNSSFLLAHNQLLCFETIRL